MPTRKEAGASVRVHRPGGSRGEPDNGSRHPYWYPRIGKVIFLQGSVRGYARSDQPGHAQDPTPGETFPRCLPRRQTAVRRGQHATPPETTAAATSNRPRLAGFKVIGYYLQSKVDDCKERNEKRAGKQVVPAKAIFGAAGRLELPSLEEGFDKLYYVRVDGNGGFVVEEWKNEV